MIKQGIWRARAEWCILEHRLAPSGTWAGMEVFKMEEENRDKVLEHWLEHSRTLSGAFSNTNYLALEHKLERKG